MAWRARAAAVVAVAFLGLAALVAAWGASPGVASSSGAWSKEPLGCYCHTGGPDGTVAAVVEGFPAVFAPGASYPLVVRLADSAGEPPGTGALAGFYLEATAGRLVAGADGLTRASADGRQATHTLSGSRALAWNITWVAPSADDAPVTLRVLVNRVDGNRAPDGGDRWGRLTLTADPPGGAGPPPPAPPDVPLALLVGAGGLAVGWAAGRAAASGRSKNATLK